MTRDWHGELSRRQFLAGASVSAWLAATHVPAIWGSGFGLPEASAGRVNGGTIRSLRLETTAPLSQLKGFYGDLLALEILKAGSGELTIKAGETRLTFVRVHRPDDAAPFYHFAFNIPENKLLAAREWQLRRTPLIPPYANLRDPQYPGDIVHFANWNAHSVFFWDPAGNLLELIARHDLNNAAKGPFGSSDILYVSEIALIADDVPTLARDLTETFALGQYRPGSDQFTAVGDELGLLLVMRRGRNLGFDQGRPAGVFPTAVSLRGATPGRYTAPGFPFEVSSV